MMSDRAAYTRLAVRCLAGRPVEVRLQPPPPPWDDCDGLALRNEAGGVVYINPALPDDRYLYVVAHEAAHIKMHWSTMPPVAAGQQLPAPPAAPSIGALKAAALREREADDQAARWVAYANKRGGSTMGGKLYALAVAGVRDAVKAL